MEDRSCNWKRIRNDRLPVDIFSLGRRWKALVPQEWVRGIKRALQTMTNFRLRNINLPHYVTRFHRLYMNDMCFHTSQYSRPVKTRNCFVLINSRRRNDNRPNLDVASIYCLFFVLFDGKEYPLAVVNVFPRANPYNYFKFKVVNPIPSDEALIISVTRIVKKVVMMEFTNILPSFNTRQTLAFSHYK